MTQLEETRRECCDTSPVYGGGSITPYPDGAELATSSKVPRARLGCGEGVWAAGIVKVGGGRRAVSPGGQRAGRHPVRCSGAGECVGSSAASTLIHFSHTPSLRLSPGLLASLSCPPRSSLFASALLGFTLLCEALLCIFFYKVFFSLPSSDRPYQAVLVLSPFCCLVCSDVFCCPLL